MQSIAAVPDSLTKLIIACAMTVHAQLGPGFLEAVYRACLWLELKAHGLHVEKERTIPLVYRGVRMDAVYRLDFIVEELVIVEAKSVQALAPIDRAQVINYLKLTSLPVGLLINFNVPLLRDGIRRLEHPDLYHSRKQ